MFFVVHSSSPLCGRGKNLFRLLIFSLLIGLSGGPGVTSAFSASPAYKKTIEWQYKQASAYYYTLRNNPSLAGKREKWLTGIHELQRIYRIDPKSKRASSCLYTIARMYRAMYEHFKLTADLEKAISFYSDVVTFFPKGNQADNALYALAQIEQEERGNLKQAVQYYDQLMRSYPTSSKKRLVKRQLSKLIAFLEKHPDYQEKVEKTPAPITPPKRVLPQPKPVEVTPTVVPPVLQKPVASKTPVAAPIATPVKTSVSPPPVKPVEKKIAEAAPDKKTTEQKKESTPAPQQTIQQVAQQVTPPALQEEPTVQEQPAEPRTKIVLSALKKVESAQKKGIFAGVGGEKNTSQVAAAVQQEPPDTTSQFQEKTPGTVEVLPVQYWSSDNYSRVVIKSSEPVSYSAKLLDQQSGVPRRLFIDFKKSYIPPKYRSPVAIEDGLLQRIQTSQLDATTVRVYLDTESIGDYKVFNLKDPFRVVVDVRGGKGRAVRVPQRKVAPQIVADIKPLVEQTPKTEETETQEEIVASETAPEEKIIRPRKRKTVPGLAKTEKHAAGENLTLAQQLGLGVRRIVIDPGHGGKDPGAVGFGLKEKDIVLNVAKKIKKVLEEKNGYEVLLTRDGDVSLSLEERTAIANTKEADLFLSIHVNAHPEKAIRGVETFYLNLATHTEAMRVAALENATSTHNMSEMQDILSELMQNEKISESSQLAEFVQYNVVSGLKKEEFYVKDLGVKQAPFYVLIGAEMPAILAEISFITNPEEAKLMKTEKYLQTLADQIVAGVLSYAENQRTAALKMAPSPETSVR